MNYKLTKRPLNKWHAQLTAFLSHAVGPDRGLNLSDMGFMEQHHAETALTDTATNGKGQLIVQQLLMEIQFLALLLMFYLELAQQGFLIDTDTH